MGQKLLSYVIVALSALATGTLLVLALPLGEQAWIAWFMLVPLLWTTKEKGFLVGFVGGLVTVFWCAWLSASGVFYHHKNFEPSTGWTYTACGLYAFSFAIFFAIWADQKNCEKPIWWLAALAVVLESVLLIEIPATVALTQYRSTLAIQASSFGGIWLVSFLVWYSNVMLVGYSRENVKNWGDGQRFITALLIFFWFSSITKSSIEDPTGGLVVGVAQMTDGLERELYEAHKVASREKPSFVVWPEFSGMLFVRGEDTSKLKDVSMTAAPFVTSFRDVMMPLPHNVAALYDRGQESLRYEKRKLFASESKMHAPGTRAVAAPLSPDTSIGLNICFDSCYPNIIRETAALPNVKVIALPTIDPDSPHYFVAAVHAAYTPFRCAENGVSMVRADGNFASMIVNEQGQIVAELNKQQKSLTATISGQRRWTVFRILGDWFWYLCIVGVATLPVWNWIRIRKTKESIQPL